MGYELPPGFRFHPTDEELIIFYLRSQAMSQPCPVPIIPEVNIYKFDPWELPGKSVLIEGEWYFFTPLDRKYPNGSRPNRATASGYWKATGTDKAIYSNCRYVGVKKALVFYEGRPPKGSKTGWIMHEYRLGGGTHSPLRVNKSMNLDEWVLCRIYQKRQSKKSTEDGDCGIETAVELHDNYEEKAMKLPRSCSLAHLIEADYFQLLEDTPLASIDDLFSTSGGSGVTAGDDAAWMRLSENHGGLFGSKFFMDPIFQ